MGEQICCFTGHRKFPSEFFDTMAKKLKQELIQLIENGVVFFQTGGALGFDTLSAITVLELRKKYPYIKLTLVLPCMNQSNGWSDCEKTIYEDIKLRCDDIIYISREYTKGCMFKRNRYLVDNSDICVCYLTNQFGGTAYTVNYARSKNLKIINLAK